MYLTEHALTLWLGMMRLSPSYNEGFHVLFPKIAGLVVSMDWEHLKASFLLLETYIVQGGEVLLRDHGIAVGGMFSATVGNVKTKAATYVMMGLDGLMRKFPVEGARLLTEAGGECEERSGEMTSFCCFNRRAICCRLAPLTPLALPFLYFSSQSWLRLSRAAGTW